MEIIETKYEDIYGITLNGRFDAMTAGMVENKLNDILDTGNYKLVIDLGKVDYISSAGLRVLLLVLKRVQKEEGGDLRLAQIVPQVNYVFDLAGFTQLFKIYKSLEEAIKSFR